MVGRRKAQGKGAEIMRYLGNVFGLWLRRRIRWSTLTRALRERPVAVAGRRGIYVLAPGFDMGCGW